MLADVRSPLGRLRDALEEYLRASAQHSLERWRGAAEGGWVDLANRHAWLCSEEAGELAEQARSLGEASPAEHGALVAHMARIRTEATVAEVRDRLTEAVGAEALPPLLERVCLAWGEGEGASHPDAGPDGGERLAAARQVLDVTQGMAEAAVERAGAGDLGELLAALRAPSLEGLFGPRDRWRRVAQDVAALGFERELSDRVRVERSHGGARARARVVAPDPPRDVRIGPSPTDEGLSSELAAAEGVGRALGLALVSPALPVELRWPVAATVPRALGTVLAQVLTHLPALERGREVGRREAAEAVWRARATLLLEARLCAAAVVLLAEGEPSERALRGGAVELARVALRVDAEEAFAVPAVCGAPGEVAARFRGRLAGLSAWYALRDRYDEDWYRNPRAAEALRAGAHSGGGLSAEAWVAEELGAKPDAAFRRLQELTDAQ
jgi:hypothetical protein